MAVCEHCGVKIIRIAGKFMHVPVGGSKTPERKCLGDSNAEVGYTRSGIRAYFIENAVKRFWRRVTKTETCWLWTGYKRRHGYGTVMVNRREQQAHRLAYELTRGPIPVGMVIDHICRNTSCVNPDHLEVVTQKENVRRSLPQRAKKAKK